MKSGLARMHDRDAGALSIYIDKEIGEKVTLPRKTRLKATWNEETKQLIIQEWID